MHTAQESQPQHHKSRIQPVLMPAVKSPEIHHNNVEGKISFFHESQFTAKAVIMCRV